MMEHFERLSLEFCFFNPGPAMQGGIVRLIYSLTRNAVVAAEKKQSAHRHPKLSHRWHQAGVEYQKQRGVSESMIDARRHGDDRRHGNGRRHSDLYSPAFSKAPPGIALYAPVFALYAPRFALYIGRHREMHFWCDSVMLNTF